MRATRLPNAEPGTCLGIRRSINLIMIADSRTLSAVSVANCISEHQLSTGMMTGERTTIKKMKTQRDSVFIASVLFTITLLFLVPAFLRDALYRKDVVLRAVGFASLTNILVGLVVVWTGFIGRYRWAWLIMLIIVSGWACPILILPIFHGKIVVTFGEWLEEAWRWPGSARIYGENLILVSLMVIALVLSIRSFFASSKGE